MRLISEGFGEDDDTTNSELRSSAVESYLCIIGEPKLPSAFLQVICWVFGEYGTADGQHSGSYITGKLCDVAEAHSSDDTVKAYAVTALMKIYAFETAVGRKVDVLPEYQSFIEELSASHSTDLQQRAYELQAVIGLDAHVVESIMPLDASCEGMQVFFYILSTLVGRLLFFFPICCQGSYLVNLLFNTWLKWINIVMLFLYTFLKIIRSRSCCLFVCTALWDVSNSFLGSSQFYFSVCFIYLFAWCSNYLEVIKLFCSVLYLSLFGSQF